MKLHVCTACVHPDEKPIEKLKDSCNHLGLDFGFYGFGDNKPCNKWEGNLKAKTADLIEYLEPIKAKYILFSDGFDSWMLEDEKTILSKFKKMKADIVVSASYTHHVASPTYKTVDKPFKWINSGQFIGKKDKLIKALSIIYGKRLEGKSSDNELWDKAYKYKWFPFKVDRDCELFLAMCTVPVNKVYFKRGRIYNSITNTYPASIHFNGPKGGSPNDVNFERMYELYLRNR